jgi:hypothetical protein
MKTKKMQKLSLAIGIACACGASVWAQVYVPGTYKNITIDGSFGDWTGVPLAYTAAQGGNNAIQYNNVYIANDETNIYIRVTLYTPRPGAFAFADYYDNIFVDADTNPATGFAVSGGGHDFGSEMLIQDGSGYQEKNGGFNEGGINGLGWAVAGSADGTDFEMQFSRNATYGSDGTPVISNSAIGLMLEGDTSNYTSVEFAPPFGGLIYTFESPPEPLTTNLVLISLTNSSWEVNASGTDLGTNWLGETYDDTGAGWTTGDGLFGYTPSPSDYPPINTPLTSGPNTYYFRTHFAWNSDIANVAFVVTNYLSDGAVYYLNGAEVRRVRMPAGTISYGTAAAATNSPVGQADVFGVDGADLQGGDNIFEVEAHQAAGSSADMVFGLSLTAAIHYPVLVVNTNLPADQSVLAGQPATFTSDVIGSGPLTYQWFFNGTNAIAGANAPSYTIPLVLTNNAGRYSLTVSNQINAMTTRAALLGVSNTPVVIVTQPVNQVAVEGRPATFSVTASGTPLILYQWFLGTQPIAGATNSSYTITSTVGTNAGVYYVAVSNPASSTNSSVADLTVLLDTIPPNLANILPTATQIVVTFSEAVDPVTASEATKYSVSGGVTVVSATQNPNNTAQVTLTTGVAMNFGTVYSLTINGVNDLFGNSAHVTGQFARDITIDGSFDDWTGLTPVYSTTAPSGNTDAADFEAIYVYNDANYYYFRVTLWTDIDPAYGQFPYYVNMFYDTDNNPATGYSAGGAVGSDLLVQSGYSYQEKDGTFNDGYPINGLNWLCLPVAPGTNFEFQMSRAATFSEDGSLVFSSNGINFVFQGMTPSFAVENQAPPSGAISYSNVPALNLASLPLGGISISPMAGEQAAVVWDPPGTLQYTSSLSAAWTNLPAATSPYVIPARSGNQFYRLAQ